MIKHYSEGRQYEPWKVIHDWKLDFNLGNTVKYLSRAGRKEGANFDDDIRKAITYLEFELLVIDDYLPFVIRLNPSKYKPEEVCDDWQLYEPEFRIVMHKIYDISFRSLDREEGLKDCVYILKKYMNMDLSDSRE